MMFLHMVSGYGAQRIGEGDGCARKVLVVSMGSGEAMVGEERFGFERGSVFFLDRDVSFEVVSGEVLVGHLLCFGAEYADFFLLQYPLARGLGLFSGLVHLGLSAEVLEEVVMQRLRTLGAEIEREGGLEPVKLLFSLLLFDMLKDRLVVAQEVDALGAMREEFLELVEKHYFEQRQAAFYARRLGVSVKRLNRLCREEWFLGRNCYGVVMERILSQAEYLLLGSDLEVKAIGFELGFSSGANFATYFVRYRGITPVQFRRAGRSSS